MRISFLRPQTFLTLVFVFGLIFVTLGDSFLPKPLSTISRNTRTSVNQVLLGWMPNPKIKRPSQQREDQVENLERRAVAH